MSVSQRIVYKSIVLIHKIKLGQAPEYLTDKLNGMREDHSYETRRKHEYKLPRYEKEKTKKTLLYKGIQEYNKINEELKNENNIMIFKNKLYKYVIEKIEIVK